MRILWKMGLYPTKMQQRKSRDLMRMTKEVKNSLVQVESFCREGGHRFTDQRQKVLEIVASSNRPLGAYDILSEMGQYFDSPKPTTVYRAIEFLSKFNFIHKIESLNAFTVCKAGHKHKGAQFLICDSCGDVEEAHLCHLPSALGEHAEDKGFITKSWNTELHGICAQCDGKSDVALSVQSMSRDNIEK